MFKLLVWLVTALVVGTVVVLSMGGGKRVTAEEFGQDWPFSVNEGSVNCEGNSALTFTSRGTVYALNGNATAYLKAADLAPIWLDDPKFPDLGVKKNVGPVFDLAELQC